MKKIITFAVAALLFTGAAFAGEGKTCGKGKGCCKKGNKEMKKEDKVKADRPAPAGEVKKA